MPGETHHAVAAVQPTSAEFHVSIYQTSNSALLLPLQTQKANSALLVLLDRCCLKAFVQAGPCKGC